MSAKQRPYFLIFCWIILLYLAGSIPALAQTSRAGEWAAKQAKKAKELRPSTPNKAEEWLDRIEDWGLLRAPKGPYPFFGSAYSGGGFAVGAGFRSYYSDTAFGTSTEHGPSPITGCSMPLFNCPTWLPVTLRAK